MTAMVHDEYGEAEDVLRLEQIDRPVIGGADVLVRDHAAGLEQPVWHAAVAGLPYPFGSRVTARARPRTGSRGRTSPNASRRSGGGHRAAGRGEVFGIAGASFAQHASAAAQSRSSSTASCPSSTDSAYVSSPAAPGVPW